MSRRARPVQTVTTAGRSLSQDASDRQRRYLVLMGIRTLCFIGAVVVPWVWARGVLIAGAVFLPYVSVVMANAGRGPGRAARLHGVAPPERPELAPGDQSGNQNAPDGH